MAVTLFAAIEVGSYEVEMKIYEISPKNGIKEVDRISHIIELGSDSFLNKKISNSMVEELCAVLKDYARIMRGYGITDNYRACAASAIREAKNSVSILDRIYLVSGIKVEVLSNSELRFVHTKAVALEQPGFDDIIKEGTALIDVGSGSVQITLFDAGRLLSTHNIRIGSLRVLELISKISQNDADYNEILEEYIDNDLQTFKKIYLKGVKIKNIIATSEYIHYMFNGKAGANGTVSVTPEEFDEIYKKLINHTGIVEDMEISEEQEVLLIPTAIIYKKIMDMMNADIIYNLTVKLCDGMVVDYAQKCKKVKDIRDFNEDMVSAAGNIAKRYMCNEAHIRLLEDSALKIFDMMKKQHGLSKRERLLLQLAVILHDCGNYVSIVSAGKASYSIIMATEIIGISHKERLMIANIVRYNKEEFDYEEIKKEGFSDRELLVIMKLTAILRICDALDKSHKEKYTELKMTYVKNEYILKIDTNEDITLEKGLFDTQAELFEEVYGVKPVLKAVEKY